MKILHISVNDKKATYRTRDGSIVCGNSDYVIEFAFDSEWDEHTNKIARFIWNGAFKEVPFSGSTCSVPIINATNSVEVGVYAGNLKTTTGATIPCDRSILCGNSEQRSDPDNTPVIEEYMERAEAAAISAEASKNETVTVADSVADAAEVLVPFAEKAEGKFDNYDYILKQFGVISEQIDSSSVLHKTVPVASDKFAYLKSIGGKTVVYNQILPYEYFKLSSGYDAPETQNGVTFTNNKDGTFTLNGTATGQTTFELFSAYKGGGFVDAIKCVGTFYLGLGATLPDTVQCLVQTNNEADDGGQGASFYGGSGSVVNVGYWLGAIDIIYLFIASGTVFDNLTLKPMLTEGAEEKPFQKPINATPGALLPANVEELKAYGANLIPYPYEDGMGKTSNGITFTVNADGSVHAKGTATGGTYFYLHKGIEYHTVTANAMSSVKTGAGKTFKDCYYLSGQKRVMVYIQSGETVDKTYYPMINYGSEAAPWARYKAPDTKALPKTLPDLHGIFDDDTGTLYADTIDFESGLLTRYITDELYIDGSDTYPATNAITSSKNTYGINIKLGVLPKNLGGVSFLCDKFTPSWSNEYGTAQMYRNGSDIMLRLYINSSVTTTEQAIAWLKENPVRVRYIYLNPITTDIATELDGFDPVFPVEPGGRIEFVNGFDADIPSTVHYNIINSN